MIRYKESLWERVFKRWAWPLLLAAMITLTTKAFWNAAAAQPDITPEEALLENKPWFEQFDDMVKRRVIRALVVYNKTLYFLNQGQQHGLSYKLLKEFEEFVNKKAKTKTLQIHIVFIPISRDQLIPYLIKSLEDVAVTNLTITPQRQKEVDFSNPLLTNVKKLVVTKPGTPPLTDVDDLAGRKINIHKSNSCYESLIQLNATFKQAGKPKMKLVLANEVLEDKDLLEMVNTGLIPMVVIDNHKTQFWKQIFDDITVHPDLALQIGDKIA